MTTYPKNQLIQALRAHQADFASVVPVNFQKDPVLIFDFSVHNQSLKGDDFSTLEKAEAYIFGKLREASASVGIGGYNEERAIYDRGEQFYTDGELRTIHLGVDIWMKTGTPVYAPLDGKIHSFKNNDLVADYGPTIILEHQLDGLVFYTLYGHLSLQSLDGKRERQTVIKGEQIATLGTPKENGNWVPHLHFQLITDMLGKKGDFIGVAPKSEREYYLNICPDPNLVLSIPMQK